MIAYFIITIYYGLATFISIFAIFSGEFIGGLIAITFNTAMTYAFLLISNTFTKHETKIRRLNNEITANEVRIKKLEKLLSEGELGKLAGKNVTLLTSTQCDLCDHTKNLEICDNCGNFYCENDYAYHILELCENHPHYDPDPSRYQDGN